MNASPVSTETATYVYGIGWASARTLSAEGVGAAAVRALEHGELAALVSDLPSPDVRARRRDLLRHAEVLQQAFERSTVLPLGFGTVFDSEDDVVAELLEPRYEELVALLQQLDGLVELTVRAFYDEEAVLSEVVRDDAEIAALRVRASPAEQVRLGEAVAQALGARRDADAGEIVASLTRVSRDLVVEERVAEFEVLRAAFLVDRGAVDEFDARLDEVASRRRDVLRVKLTGPLPPHHFVSERWAS
jgi:hypothetical protein